MFSPIFRNEVLALLIQRDNLWGEASRHCSIHFIAGAHDAFRKGKMVELRVVLCQCTGSVVSSKGEHARHKAHEMVHFADRLVGPIHIQLGNVSEALRPFRLPDQVLCHGRHRLVIHVQEPLLARTGLHESLDKVFVEAVPSSSESDHLGGSGLARLRVNEHREEALEAHSRVVRRIVKEMSDAIHGILENWVSGRVRQVAKLEREGTSLCHAAAALHPGWVVSALIGQANGAERKPGLGRECRQELPTKVFGQVQERLAV
mmetsp:Transcript_24771/g.79097  ORF Transcript_24771/g.79097 Transcript_24771/m.79097 type:complete len:261 (-) Transcript_24771:651-1433(-)